MIPVLPQETKISRRIGEGLNSHNTFKDTQWAKYVFNNSTAPGKERKCSPEEILKRKGGEKREIVHG